MEVYQLSVQLFVYFTLDKRHVIDIVYIDIVYWYVISKVSDDLNISQNNQN